MKRAWILGLLLFFGCDKYYVSVKQLSVGPTYLASTHVGTPDPRQANPPEGQKLFIDWAIPEDVLEKSPRLVMYLLYKDHSQKELIYPIEHQRGYKVYSLLNNEFRETKGLLTYRAEIVTEGGEIYKDWKHQLWVNLITLEDINSSASDTSSSVSDQSTQGSVIETPGMREEGFSESS